MRNIIHKKEKNMKYSTLALRLTSVVVCAHAEALSEPTKLVCPARMHFTTQATQYKDSIVHVFFDQSGAVMQPNRGAVVAHADGAVKPIEVPFLGAPSKNDPALWVCATGAMGTSCDVTDLPASVIQSVCFGDLSEPVQIHAEILANGHVQTTFGG